MQCYPWLTTGIETICAQHGQSGNVAKFEFNFTTKTSQINGRIMISI